MLLLLLVPLLAGAADDFVRVGPDSTGKRIDNDSFTRGADTLYRQRVRIGGVSDADLVTPLASAPGGTEYALPVRNIPSGTQAVSGTVTIQDGGNVIDVQGTVTATGPLTDAQLRATAVPVSGTITIGTFPDNEPVNLAQIGGTAAVTGGVAGSVAVGGTAAHSAVVNANPIVMGAYAEADAAALDSSGVVEGDSTRLKADLEGRLFVRPDHPRRVHCRVVSTATVLTAFGGSCATPGAGLSLYITDITAGSSAAGGVAVDAHLTIKSGTGGTCGTSTTTVWSSLSVANGPVIENLGTPIKVTAAHELCWIMSTAATKVWSIKGFIAP